MFYVWPHRADAAHIGLRVANWAFTIPGPGGKYGENQAKLGLIIAQQFDIFHGAGRTDRGEGKTDFLLGGDQSRKGNTHGIEGAPGSAGGEDIGTTDARGVGTGA